MKRVHVANTNFEAEIAHPSGLKLGPSLASHPIALQLQFLPLLMALPDEFVAVTHFPSEDYVFHLEKQLCRSLAQMALMEEIEGGSCLSWGATRQVYEWALEKGIHYDMPTNWEMIKTVNSKAFSLELCPLEGAKAIWNEKELISWFDCTEGRKVIKTCFGLSGMGQRLSTDHCPSKGIVSFCQQEWAQGLPVIAEPWLDRCLDFSTQWFIPPEGSVELLGPTLFETDEKGTYQGTRAGPPRKLFGPHYPFLEEHLERSLPLLELLRKKGFFGHVGLDAFVYQAGKGMQVRAIVEVNARQTMSLFALRMQQQKFEENVIALRLVPLSAPHFSLLPLQIGTQTFKKKLIFEIYCQLLICLLHFYTYLV